MKKEDSIACYSIGGFRLLGGAAVASSFVTVCECSLPSVRIRRHRRRRRRRLRFAIRRFVSSPTTLRMVVSCGSCHLDQTHRPDRRPASCPFPLGCLSVRSTQPDRRRLRCHLWKCETEADGIGVDRGGGIGRRPLQPRLGSRSRA